MESYLDQYRKYSGEYKNSDPDSDAAKAAKAGMASAAIGGTITALQGLGDITNTMMSSAHINDTSRYQNQIQGIRTLGYNAGSSFSELDKSSQMIGGLMPNIDYRDIRGMSTAQQIGQVGSSTLSGATAGLSIGGPWGAIIGGAIGLGGGLYGVLTGNDKAMQERGLLHSEGELAQYYAQKQIDNKREQLRNEQFTQGVMHAVANGGKIEKKQIDIASFAKRALAKPRMKEHVPIGRVIRQACDGGVMIRIKR